METDQLTQRKTTDAKAWMWGRGVKVVIATTLTLAVIVIWALAGFGSLSVAAAYYLKGQTLFVDSTSKSMGVASPGETVVVPFRLTNHGRERVRIVGCYAYCNCMLPGDLPFTMAPGEVRNFNVSIKMPTRVNLRGAKSASLKFPLTLFTSIPAQSRVGLSIEGECRDEIEAQGSTS
jgi:hypothetical protein